MNVLLVDDEPVVLEPIRGLVEGFGHQCMATLDPIAALGLCESQRYDIAILDYVMPGMDGLELARRIRAISPATRIMLLTAYGSVFYQRQEREPEVDAVVQKPVTALQLSTAIRRLVDGRAVPAKEDEGEVPGDVGARRGARAV